MPRFDFQCQACSYTFEEELPFGSNDAPACPQCGGTTKKVITPPAIHFKGAGFYNTDSAPASKTAEKKEERLKKRESKQEDAKKEEKKPQEKNSTKDTK